MSLNSHFKGKAVIEKAMNVLHGRKIKSKDSSRRVPRIVREKLTKIRRLWNAKNRLQRQLLRLHYDYNRCADKLISTYPLLLEIDVPHLAQIRDAAGRKKILPARRAEICMMLKDDVAIHPQLSEKHCPIFPDIEPIPCTSHHSHIRKFSGNRRAVSPS